MRTLTKTALIFTTALLSITAVMAQKPKVDKKAARLAAYQKMIDTPDFRITLEKAFPKNANQINLTGAPSISVSGGVAEGDLPYYAGANSDQNSRIKFSTANIVYQAQKAGSGQQYNMLIQPKPGSTDMGDITQIVISIITEENVSVSISFSDKDAAGFQGYIEKYKKE